MQKSLYSMMLMDSVVREIDRIALQKNTNRSNLVNQILAEYVSMVTPEQRVDSIFRYIEQVMNNQREIVPFVEPNNFTMSLKSSLAYKYRPTIKYEVELYRVPKGTIGELSVIYRTQSGTLQQALHTFFSYWKQLEDSYLPRYFTGTPAQYRLEDGRFVRSIALPNNRDYTGEEIGDAISAYIQMFDEMMKGFVNGDYTPAGLESRYVAYLNRGVGIL